MPRSIWNGTVTFGMVQVPVKLYSATSSRRISLREVHLVDGAPIQHRRICSADGEEVPYKEVVKGYEIDEDEYLVLEPEEISAAAGDHGKKIEIEMFTAAADIDPEHYEKTYHLGFRDDAEAYAVLHEALDRTGKAGIGRFTFHNREYLVAIRSLGEVIALHTMRYHDELIPSAKVSVPSPKKGPTEKEIDLARKLIASLEIEFDPAAYEDTYRKAVLELVERKAKGETVELPEVQEPEQTGDLSAALEASLA